MIWKRTGLCYQVQSNQDSIKGPSLFFPKLLPIIAFYPIIFLTPANILDSNHSPQRNKQIKSAITQITQEVLQIVCIWDIIWQILLILLDFAQMSLGSSLGRQGQCPSSLHKATVELNPVLTGSQRIIFFFFCNFELFWKERKKGTIIVIL